jgi:hypothetical protein
MGGDRLPPTAKIGTCSRVWSVPRHRIAAMVCGDDQQIVQVQSGQQIGKPPVERFERCRITHKVAAVAVDRIEVDEVRKQQAAVRKGRKTFQRPVEQGVVTVPSQDATGSAMGEDVADFADRDRVTAGGGGEVKDGPPRGGTE